LDLSSPHQDDVELGQGIPMSVNSGIQKKDYITKMSSTRQWVKSLERAGVGARMSKADWQAAYKHLMVRPEDYRLQVFKFGEKFFIEIRLVFGAVSSPALFNDPARMAIIMAVMESGLDLKLVQQQLDDCCAAGRGEDGKLAAFTRIYRELCGRWGISLADVDVEKEKAFELETEGIVLGIGYDTISWSWWLPRDKLDWILIQLADLETAETVTNGEMMRLNGKLAHYHVLVPGGKWWRTPLLDLSDSGGRKSKVYEVTEGAKECARWWFIRLMCMRQGPRRLADLRGGIPASAAKVYPDAAGVSVSDPRKGAGACLEDGSWSYLPWVGKIKNSDLGRNLSLLEGVAALMGVVMGVVNYPGQPLAVQEDNQGFCFIFRAGNSRCRLCWTIAKAIEDVSKGAGVRVAIVKVGRV
jgi:hypothetical protein